MPNRGVKGRIIDENGAGLKALTVRAVDFDPFFHEDDVLKTGKTDADGKFELTYSTEDFTFWDPHRIPTSWSKSSGRATKIPSSSAPGCCTRQKKRRT